MTPAEKAGVKSYYENHKLFSPDRMRAALEAYADFYAAQEKKYRQYGNVRFSDIRGLFDEVPDEVYVDDVHYNASGNKMLAQRFYQDIQACSVGNSHGVSGQHILPRSRVALARPIVDVRLR